MIKRALIALFIFASILVSAQSPTATISVLSGTICTGQTALFTSATSGTPTAYQWTVSPTNGPVIPFSSNQPSVAISFTRAGVFTVSLTVSNATGTTSTTRNITIIANPAALFTASFTGIGVPNTLDLTNNSTNATSYLWVYYDGTLNDNTLNASHTYTAAGSYTVSLLAMNSSGCSDFVQYTFSLNAQSAMELPNIFTPNADGINDIFKPIAYGMSAMKVDIYNRWGNYVYGWNTINGFWDGHTISGEACMNGTYFVVVEATGFDGQTYSMKTNLTLLRN